MLIIIKSSAVNYSQHIVDDSTKRAKSGRHIFRASLHYGALLGYKDYHAPLIFTHPYGVELSATKLSLGRKKWESLYNFPSVVYGLAYYNYGLPHDYGEAYTGTVSYDFNLSKHKLWLAGGIGLVYSTRKFNEEANPYNKAISTDIAYVLQGSLRYDINISQHWIVSPTFSFRHFSSATLGIPNNGMNFPLIGAGIGYHPGNYIKPLKKDTIFSIDKRIHFTLSAGLAIKKVLRIDDRHKIYCVSFYAERQVTKYNSVVLGFDAFYNNSLYSEYLKRARSIEESEIDHRQFAFTFGQELFIGKIGVLTQGGIFLYQPHKFDGSFYQKYGIKYYLTKDLFLGSILKVYTGTADYMEWAAGAKF